MDILNIPPKQKLYISGGMFGKRMKRVWATRPAQNNPNRPPFIPEYVAEVKIKSYGQFRWVGITQVKFIKLKDKTKQ